MLTIYLIRHSVTDGNIEKRYVGSTDEGLNEIGIRLAENKEKPSDIEKVFTSPMNRCIETADIMFKGIEKHIVDGLRETDFGDFEYKNYEELKYSKDYQKWIDSLGRCGFPNGEGFWEAYERAIQAFGEIIRFSIESQYKKIAIVTHGGTIMSIMDKFSDSEKDYFDWRVKNCEGYILKIDGGKKCYR